MTGLRIQVASCLTSNFKFPFCLCFPFLIGCMVAFSLEVSRGKSQRNSAIKSAECMSHEAASFVKPRNPHFIALIGRSSKSNLVSSYFCIPQSTHFRHLHFVFNGYEHKLIVIIVVLIMPIKKMIMLLNKIRNFQHSAFFVNLDKKMETKEIRGWMGVLFSFIGFCFLTLKQPQ